MIPLIIGAATELIKSVVDSDNKKEREIINSYNQRDAAMHESNNRRNVEIAKTLIEGAVTAFSAYQQAKAVQAQQLQRSEPTYQNYPAEMNVTPQTPMLNPGEPIFSVDRSTIWVDRAKNEMGARVIEENSGQSADFKYRIQGVGNKVHKIYESVNGSQWVQVGIIDWKYMKLSNLGTNETGGPIFAEIMQTAMRKR